MMPGWLGWPKRWTRGSAGHGFGVDRRWTLARVWDLVARLFRVRYTVRGTAHLMYRLGWSVAGAQASGLRA